MNPFNYISIAQGDNFYDRKEETQRIVKTLSGGNNIVLFAPRRYGKTSLVFRVMSELESKGIVCVYMDLMPVYSLESFVELYLQALYKKQTFFEQFIQLLSSLKNIRPKLTFSDDGKPVFGIEYQQPKIDIATVSQILELPEKMSQNGKRIVVVFDEFQEVNKLNKFGFEALIRSKIQLQHNVNYMFLGSKTHLIKEMFMAKNRPFYNSAMTIQLSSLPTADTCEFLQSKFGQDMINISEEMCKYIISYAENIPYYIQLLSAEIWQYMMPDLRVVTKEIVDESFKRIVELKRDYYFELNDKLSALQRRLLLSIANSGKNIYSSAYIAQYHLIGASSIQKAVVVLQDEGLVDKDSDAYFVSDPFFRSYLLNYAS